jgi:HSP20 family protein
MCLSKANKEKKKPEKEKEEVEIEVYKEQPYSLFQEMDLYMDRMRRQFDDFLGPTRSLIPKFDESLTRTPLSNVVEDENSYNITAEIPGLEKNEIDISYQKGLLEIKGESKTESKEEVEGQVVRREYHSSKFYRSFSLPDNVDEENMLAELDKGLLKITLPKKVSDKKDKKKIQIK